jgi:hypothetical protein
MNGRCHKPIIHVTGILLKIDFREWLMHIMNRSDTDNEFSQNCLMVIVVDDVKQDPHLVLLDWPDVVGSNQK